MDGLERDALGAKLVSQAAIIRAGAVRGIRPLNVEIEKGLDVTMMINSNHDGLAGKEGFGNQAFFFLEGIGSEEF